MKKLAFSLPGDSIIHVITDVWNSPGRHLAQILCILVEFRIREILAIHFHDCLSREGMAFDHKVMPQ